MKSITKGIFEINISESLEYIYQLILSIYFFVKWKNIRKYIM